MEKLYIVFHNINNCEGIDVYNTSHEIISHIDTPAQITGFEYELDAAIEAIQNGRTECTRMPHAEIIAVMEIMDRIREKTVWSIRKRFIGDRIMSSHRF